MTTEELLVYFDLTEQSLPADREAAYQRLRNDLKDRMNASTGEQRLKWVRELMELEKHVRTLESGLRELEASRPPPPKVAPAPPASKASPPPPAPVVSSVAVSAPASAKAKGFSLFPWPAASAAAKPEPAAPVEPVSRPTTPTFAVVPPSGEVQEQVKVTKVSYRGQTLYKLTWFLGSEKQERTVYKESEVPAALAEIQRELGSGPVRQTA